MSSQLLDAGLPPAQDRLLTTCFLAALLHGIIILGVTFSAPKHLSKGPAARALEVILVSDKT
ncbi:MAG: energy transducer TonB, partial [Steroidobacteraceae bacterium]|nr:energy transducer TonB [Steroidobacteraceae bacterium]